MEEKGGEEMNLREQFKKETGISWNYYGDNEAYWKAYSEWLESRLSHPVTDAMIEEEAAKRYFDEDYPSRYCEAFEDGGKYVRDSSFQWTIGL